MNRGAVFLTACLLAAGGAVAAGVGPAGAAATPAVAAVNSFTVVAAESAPLGDVSVTEAAAGELPVGDVFTFQFKDSAGAATIHFATAGTVGGTNGLAATAAVASSNTTGTPLDDEVKVTVTAASSGTFPGVLTLSGLTAAVGGTATSGADQVVVSDTQPVLPAPVTVSDASVAAAGTLLAPYATQETPTILGTANGQSVGNVTITEPAKSFFHAGDVITLSLRDVDGSADTVGLGGTPYAAGGSMTVSVSGESGPTVQVNDTAFEVDVVAGDPSQGSASTITVSNLVVNTAVAPVGPVTLSAVVTAGPDAGVPLYPGRVAVANVGGNTSTSSAGAPPLTIGTTGQLAGNVTIAATAGSLVHGDTISLQIQTSGVTFTAAAPPVATVTSGSLVLADAGATLDGTGTTASWTVATGNLTGSTVVIGPISYDVGVSAAAGQSVTLLASGEAGSAFTSQLVSDAVVASPPTVGAFAASAATPIPSTSTAPFDGASVVYAEASAGATPVGASIVLIAPYATQIAAYRTTFAAIPSATTTGGLTLGTPTVNSSATVVATPQGTIDVPAQTIAVFPVTAASTTSGTATFSGLAFNVGSLVPPGTFLLDGVVEASGGLTAASAGNPTVDLVDTHGLGTSAATTPPTVSFTQTPPSITNLTYATFAFLADEAGSTFACALDGIVVSLNCPTPITLPGLSNGTHTFTVQAFNPSGFGSTPLSFTWIVESVPPTATVALPKAVTGPLTVTFSTPVEGVGTSTVVLSQVPASGPPVTLPAALTCVTQAGVRSACAGTSFFTKVLVQPAAQLVPGQHYSLTLNPVGVTPAITDQAGNVLATVADSFRGGLVQDEGSAAATPSGRPSAQPPPPAARTRCRSSAAARPPSRSPVRR
jgi:hypothetical protein